MRRKAFVILLWAAVRFGRCGRTETDGVAGRRGHARGTDLRPRGRQDHAQPRGVRLPWARRHDEEFCRQYGLFSPLAGGRRRLHAGARHGRRPDRSRGKALRLAACGRRPRRPRPEILRRRAGDPQERVPGRRQADLRHGPFQRRRLHLPALGRPRRGVCGRRAERGRGARWPVARRSASGRGRLGCSRGGSR